VTAAPAVIAQEYIAGVDPLVTASKREVNLSVGLASSRPLVMMVSTAHEYYLPSQAGIPNRLANELAFVDKSQFLAPLEEMRA